MLENTLLRIAVALETIASRPWPAPQAEPEVVKPSKKKKAETPPEPVDIQPATQAPAGEATEPVPPMPAGESPSDPPAPAPDPAAIKAALNAALSQYMLAHSRDELVALLARFGAKRMMDIDPVDHPALLAEVEAALV